MPNDSRQGSDRALPIRICEIDIAHGIDSIGGCEGFGSARALIRHRGVPLGWLNLTCQGGVIDAAQILRAVRLQLDAPARHITAGEVLRASGTSTQLPPISVIVCTRDRPELLARCLESLGRINYPTFDVLVIDNASSSDQSRQVAERAGARCVREELPGLDRARNRGWTSATYDIVAFTDDDVEVDTLWLRGVARGFADPAVQFVTGLIAPARMDTEAEFLFELTYGGMGKGTFAVRWDPSRMTARELIAAHHVGVGANMAFRRALLASLGGFDPALDIGTASHGGGDLDIFHRALVRGAVGKYEPAALVRHHHRRDMAALRRQHYDNGRAFGVYLFGILKRGDIARHRTLWFAFRYWLAWLVRRFVRRMLARDPLPSQLILAELQGALHAPWAYHVTYREARALDNRAPVLPASSSDRTPVSAA